MWSCWCSLLKFAPFQHQQQKKRAFFSIPSFSCFSVNLNCFIYYTEWIQSINNGCVFPSCHCLTTQMRCYWIAINAISTFISHSQHKWTESFLSTHTHTHIRVHKLLHSQMQSQSVSPYLGLSKLRLGHFFIITSYMLPKLTQNGTPKITHFIGPNTTFNKQLDESINICTECYLKMAFWVCFLNCGWFYVCVWLVVFRLQIQCAFDCF